MRKSLPLLLISALLLGATLTDQTSLIVGKQVYTLRNVEVDAFVHQILEQKRPIDFTPVRTSSSKYEKAQSQLLKRLLYRNYLITTGLLTAAPPERVAKLRGVLHSALGGAEGARNFFEKAGITPSEVDRALSDQAMADVFFADHAPFRGLETEAEIKAHYEKYKDSKFLGKPFSQVSDLAKASLKREKSEKAMEEWLKTEMSRTEVILLPLAGEELPSAK